MRYQKKFTLYIFVILLNLPACKKYLEIDKVPDLMVATEIYSNEANATAAVAGIYRSVRDQQAANPYSLSLITGLSGDELVNFSPNANYDEFRGNRIQPTNTQTSWARWYKMIYQANAVIEGIQQGSQLSTALKNQLIAEAKFLRAYSYFNLVNLFGDVPMLTQTDVVGNARQARVPVTDIYQQVITDLKEAAQALPAGFGWNGNNRTRAISWSARALLARVYLYQQNWDLAAQEATDVINSGLFSLVNNLDSITLRNNTEAIFQLATSATDGNNEATNFIFTVTPILLCSNSLLASFEPGDTRKTKWIRSTPYAGQPRFYPYKYKITALGSNENYIILRLAEQYLVRAEAMAQKNNLAAAITDINRVRSRAGLSTLIPGLAQQAVLDTIAHERRVELFTETGHRWWDLKRTGKINSVLAAEKPADWKPFAALYPLPLADIQNNPQLVQNPGY